MTAQLALELEPLTVPTYAPDLTIQQRFDLWIAENKWVIPTIELLIRRWLDAGHERVGMKQVWEVLRWQYGMTVGDTFKANNSYTSRCARLILERHPEWAGAIETRNLRAA